MIGATECARNYVSISGSNTNDPSCAVLQETGTATQQWAARVGGAPVLLRFNAFKKDGQAGTQGRPQLFWRAPISHWNHYYPVPIRFARSGEPASTRILMVGYLAILMVCYGLSRDLQYHKFPSVWRSATWCEAVAQMLHLEGRM